MTHTLHLTAEVAQDREVRIRLPEDVPVGTARLVLEITPETEYRENLQDLEDAERALAEAEEEGTITLAALKEELGL